MTTKTIRKPYNSHIAVYSLICFVVIIFISLQSFTAYGLDSDPNDVDLIEVEDVESETYENITEETTQDEDDINELTDTEEAEDEHDIVNLQLPSDLPFNLVVPKNGFTGIVYSNVFEVTNHDETAVSVKFDNVRAEIEDNISFSLSDSPQLPEDGNNLHLVLAIIHNGSSKEHILSNEPQALDTFLIESGETVYLQISGTVNQRGNAAWDETLVTLSIVFAIDKSN